MKRPIKNLEDVVLLVDDFYAKVQKDEHLADIFNAIIQNRWSEHLQKMYQFWQTILLGEHTYKGTPFIPHAHLPVEKFHFDRWLKLFNETVIQHFEGEVADEAIWRASKMANMFQMKIEYYKKSTTTPIQ